MLDVLVVKVAEPEEPGVYLYQLLCVLAPCCVVQAGIGSPVSVVAPVVVRESVKGAAVTVMALAKSSLAGGGVAAALTTPVPPVPLKSDNMM